ncbi:MAG: hypothetical protein PHY08_09770, partial [Candidatus Cloacimonetes bacterium]|nr:hypothetical protein [Candidatus Cloacimonadota bacterium]
MKRTLLVLLILVSLASFSQTLKTKTAKVFQPYGSYTTREVTHGDLTYTCYTDEKGNEIRHGNFTYKYNLYQDIPFNNIWAEGKETYNVSITGKYKDGNIDGTWQLSVIRKNAQYQGKIFYSRNRSLTANFSKGKPNGLWKYSATTTWSIFNDNTLRIERSTDMLSKPTSVSIIANFNEGIPSGKFDSKIMNDYSGDFYNGSDIEFVAIFDENGNATKYDKLSLKNYKEDIYYNTNISIPEYEENPAHYNIKECELKIDLDEYIYDYFLSNDFNWDELVGTPNFGNGVFKYKEIIPIPKISFISLEMPWTLEKFLKSRNIIIEEQTEEQCLEISHVVKNLKDIVKNAKENNDLLPDDRILTDYEQYIPKLDSAEVFFTNAYESKKAERLKKEEEAKLLA